MGRSELREKLATQRLGVALALLFLGLFLNVPAAQALNWSIQKLPTAEAEHSTLADLACEPESTSTCTAVGKKIASGKSTAYAQYWDGATWVNQTVTLPFGATGELQSNDCVSKTSCVAVGSLSSGKSTLFEVWNGSSWSFKLSPNIFGATENQLKGISCSASTACTAVGYSSKEGVTSSLVISGNPNAETWSVQSVPKPAEAVSTELNGIHCVTASWCVAVGRYTLSSGTRWAMAAFWNGTSWTLQTIPKPSGSTRSVLLDISCTEYWSCVAAGGYDNSSGVQQSFVVRLVPTEWKYESSPNPSGSANTVLQNVSCGIATSCVAVGDWLNAGTWQPMAQTFNNSGWSLDSTTNPAGATFGILEGVACRIRCLSIGWYTDSAGANKPLGEVRDIATWTQRSVPEGASVKRLEGVSCFSTSACQAVGYETSGSTNYARAFTWNGTSWSALPKPEAQSRFYDVACPSATYCIAAGYMLVSGVEKPWAARYSSPFWLGQLPPLPPESSSGRLLSISCTSSTYCKAVGLRAATPSEGTGSRQYAATWNGTTWSLDSVPSLPGYEMTDVSCFSSSWCMAVGFGSFGVTATRWNGTNWSHLTAPAKVATASGVSCTSATECTVVGDGDFSYAAASRWNSTTSSWSLLGGAPGFAFAKGSRFQDISCTSSTACTATGKIDLASSTKPLAANWDGSNWVLQDVVNPSAGDLSGVSCPTSTSCHSVGSTGTQAIAESFP